MKNPVNDGLFPLRITFAVGMSIGITCYFFMIWGVCRYIATVW